MIAGVCAGIGEYFNIDATLVRILAVVLVCAALGFPLILYIVGMIVIPKQPVGYSSYIDVEPTAPNPMPGPPPAQGAAQPHATAHTPGAAYTATDSVVYDAVPPGAAAPFAAPGAPGTTAPQGAQGAPSAQGSAPAPGTPGAPDTHGTHGVPGAQGSTPPPGPYGTQGSYGAPVPPGPSPQQNPEDKKGGIRTAVGFGIILVGIGVLALLGNFVHISVWRFWPLIIVLFGLVRLFTPGRTGWSLERAGSAITLITVGVALQVWMLGLIAFSTFIICFWHLWPILLVIGGLAIIGAATHKSGVKLIGSLLFSATLLFGVWYYGAIKDPVVIGLPNGNDLRLVIPESPEVPQFDNLVQHDSIDMSAYKEANFSFNGGGAYTTISANAGPELQLEGLEGRKPTLNIQESNPPTVRLETGHFIPDGSLSVLLPEQVIWNSIDINTGASSTEMDLSKLKVRTIDIESGASSTGIKLGAALEGGSLLDIEAGIASVRVDIPKNAAVLIESDGLNSVTFDGDEFTWSDSLGAWCSKTYIEVFGGNRRVDGAKIWRIDLDGMSSLDIDTY
jgi:phage shock protein PspC (stress-responsive transcriptional regulator)